MTNPDYEAAKIFLNRLPDAQKVKLCKQTLAGVEDKKKTSKQRVNFYLKYLDKK